MKREGRCQKAEISRDKDRERQKKGRDEDGDRDISSIPRLIVFITDAETGIRTRPQEV